MTEIIIKLDDELKKESELLFNKLGLDIKEAIVLFLQQAVKEGDIPFSYALYDDKLIEVSDAVIEKYIDAYRELAK